MPAVLPPVRRLATVGGGVCRRRRRPLRLVDRKDPDVGLGADVRPGGAVGLVVEPRLFLTSVTTKGEDGSLFSLPACVLRNVFYGPKAFLVFR